MGLTVQDLQKIEDLLDIKLRRYGFRSSYKLDVEPLSQLVSDVND